MPVRYSLISRPGGFTVKCACGAEIPSVPTPKAARDAHRLHVRDDCPIGRR